MNFAAFTFAALVTVGNVLASPLHAKFATAAQNAQQRQVTEFATEVSNRVRLATTTKSGGKTAPEPLAPLGEMSPEQIGIELVGPPMKGSYADGQPWDETYFHDGSIVYRDAINDWQGIWSFRGSGFCTFYNDEQNGGCWTVLKISANCYEFYPVSRAGKLKSLKPGERTWTAQGWRTTQGSTCDIGAGV